MSLFKQTGLRWLWLAALVILLDQLSKLAVLQWLPFGYPGQSLVPYFNLVHVYNKGAAFSFLANQPGWQRWFFTLFALGVSAVLLVWLRKLPAAARWSPIAYCLIIGGALGNLIDRLAYGHVVDFIDFHVGQWHYPAFNLADSAICVGAVMIVLEGLLLRRSPPAGDKPS
ncbi:signal peptidase II [Pseudaeromonas sp. ZJS20]|uniref:signal peptidase II n=1 Tax=Pseudaeromonas aegiceratis TaxID=3153928 RepID=UPI00390CBAE3